MAHAFYQFRPVEAADLPLLHRWLAEPHVAEWWGNADEQFALVRGDLDDPAMMQFIVIMGEQPFAYLQSYELSAWPDPAFEGLPSGTCGIDQFIGESEMINRGHGSAFIRCFVDNALAGGAPRIITDPAPANARAIRAYEKAGFCKDRIVDTVEGPALLMVCDA